MSHLSATLQQYESDDPTSSSGDESTSSVEGFRASRPSGHGYTTRRSRGRGHSSSSSDCDKGTGKARWPGSESDSTGEPDPDDNTWPMNSSSPKKVIKAGQACLTAWLCIAQLFTSDWQPCPSPSDARPSNPRSIPWRATDPSNLRPGQRAETDYVEAPWREVGQALTEVHQLWPDRSVQQTEGLSQALRVLMSVIVQRVMPLARSATYARSSLSKSEAQARVRFLKIWRFLVDDAHDLADQPHMNLRTFDRDLLVRIAFYAVTRRRAAGKDLTYLDLQGLEFSPDGFSESHDVVAALRLFGIQTGQICLIDLRSCQLSKCPPWLFGQTSGPPPFPNLDSLHISNNKSLSALPARIFRTSIQHIVAEQTKMASDASTDKQRAALPRPQTDPFGHRVLPSPSLVNACLRVLLTADVDCSELPSHIDDVFRASYLCDLCDIPCVRGTKQWMKRRRFIFRLSNLALRAHSVSLNRGSDVDVVRVEGRICAECLL